MASFLQELAEKVNKPFLWKYFATSHGTGVVDGIGGQVKSIVRSAVMSKGRSAALVQNARDFYEVAAKLMPSTTVILIEEKDIVRDRNWDDSEAIPGIKSCHVLMAEPQHTLKMFFNALTPVSKSADVGSSKSTSKNVLIYRKVTGLWYDTNHRSIGYMVYPGQVTGFVGPDIEKIEL